MKIWQHDKRSRTFLGCIGKEISKLMDPQRIERSVGLNLHVFFCFKYLLIEVENVILVIFEIVDFVDKIITNFDDIVVIIQVTVSQCVETCDQSSNEFLIVDSSMVELR